MDKEKNSYGSCAGCGDDLTPEEQSINNPTFCTDCDPELDEEDDDYEVEEDDDDCECCCDEDDECEDEEDDYDNQ